MNALYKLATSDESRALNANQISECVQRPAGEIADDMRKLTLKLFSDFLSPDGRFVDYKGIGTSKTFEVQYVRHIENGFVLLALELELLRWDIVSIKSSMCAH